MALDAVALRAAAVSNDTIELICPYRYATPVAHAHAALPEQGVITGALKRRSLIGQSFGFEKIIALPRLRTCRCADQKSRANERHKS